MPKNTKLTSIISKIKFFGNLIWVWPDNKDSKTYIKYLNDFCWVLWTTSFLLGEIGLTSLNLYYNFNNLSVVAEILPLLSYRIHIVLATILWKYYQNDLRILLIEIMNFVESSDEINENNLLYKFLDRHLYLCICNASIYGIIFICYTLGPLFLQYNLPAVYPFSIELYSTKYYLAYSYFSFEVFRASYVATIIPFMLITLFSYPIIKFESLSLKLKTVKSQIELNNCIKQQEDIFRFIERLNSTLRFIIFEMYIAATTSTVFSGISMILSQTHLTTFRLALAVGVVLLQVYFPAQFSDDLDKASQQIAFSVYDADWTTYPINMRKSMIIMMCRAQRGSSISVSGIIPTLNKQFFASYVSFALSYYMALRVLFYE